MLRIWSRVVFVLLLIACQKENQTSSANRRHYANIFVQSDFGDLPAMPNGLRLADDPKFESLIDASGRTQHGVVKADKTQFAIGLQEDYTLECELVTGQDLLLVATVISSKGDKYFIAQLPKACDAAKTRNSNSLTSDKFPLLEAYVFGLNVNQKPSPGNVTKNQPAPVQGATNFQGTGCVKAEQIYQSSGSNQQMVCSSDSTAGSIWDNGACSFPANKPLDQVFLQVTFKPDVMNDKLKKIQVQGVCKKSSNGPQSAPVVTFESKDVKTPDANVYSFAFDKFFSFDSVIRKCLVPLEFTVVGINESENEQPNVCVHSIRLVSPIVLKLNNNDQIKTVQLGEREVYFDLDTDGKKEKTGWIEQDYGFLIYDFNGNGLVDNGSELFGEFTNGIKRENGYSSLKEIAGNGKGFVAESDDIFPKLKVWMDKNFDGVSQQHEIKTLKQVGITRINYTYKPYTKKNGRPPVFGNEIRFSSKFFGPPYCPLSGCDSFDVFFATIGENYVRKN